MENRLTDVRVCPGGGPWLPQPAIFGDLARDQQENDSELSLSLSRHLLAMRKQYRLGHGALSFVSGWSNGVPVFDSGPVRVVANLSDAPVAAPDRVIIASSTTEVAEFVAPQRGVGVRRESSLPSRRWR